MAKQGSEIWLDMEAKLREFLEYRGFDVVEAYFIKSEGEIREDKRLSSTSGYFIHRMNKTLYKREFVINMEEFNDVKL